MVRSTEEFRGLLKAARRAGTPLLAIRTADPASAIAQVTSYRRGEIRSLAVGPDDRHSRNQQSGRRSYRRPLWREYDRWDPPMFSQRRENSRTRTRF